jgi:hypothetical protein
LSTPTPAQWNHPCWAPYRDLLARLDLARFPTPADLNRLLPPDAVSGGGAPLRFVGAEALPGVDYERRIFETGEVSTRGQSGHDLFNALVWCVLPRLKAALNAVHYRNLERQSAGCRGPRRDALTLLDESGALVLSRNRDLLDALARRDWRAAFVGLRDAWSSETRVVIGGHAVLEKCLDPWKSITAHALLLSIDVAAAPLAAPDFIGWLDAELGDRLRRRGLCDRPGDLSPLPLAGIPRWWRRSPQDAGFYGDAGVFRAPPARLLPAPVHPIGTRVPGILG